MNLFDHYILTRFNLIMNEYWKTDHSLLLSDLWLEKRFNIFKTYTYPSIINQTNKNFKYILLLDKKTPSKFIDKFIELKLFYKIYFIDGFFGFSQFDEQPKILSNFIENDSESEYIITTNLDNDDIIHKDYTEKIQKTFNYQINTIVEIENGYKYYIEKKLLFKYNFPFSQFVNLIEKRKKCKTCYYCGHTIIPSLNYNIEKINDSLWIINSHDLNEHKNSRSIESYEVRDLIKNIVRQKSLIFKDFGINLL